MSDFAKSFFEMARDEMKFREQQEERIKQDISNMTDDEIKKELLNYDEILNDWFDKVVTKADKCEKLKEEALLDNCNKIDIKYARLSGYIDGLYMATSILSLCEKKAIRKIRKDAEK